jgi:predicted CXXCH cytochrome family protein
MRRVLAVLVVVAALSAARAQDAGAKYVGTAPCMGCHIDFAKLWAGVKHSQALLKPGRAPEQTGCEACHGPGSQHAAGDRARIVAWDKIDRAQANGICLKCHAERGLTPALWEATAHSQVLRCNDCHEVHRPQKREMMLRRAEGHDCSPCHDNLADKIKAKEHHTLADGALTCGQCHTLHGGNERHLLKKPQEALCHDCHGDDVPKPDSHKAKSWKLGHKAEAKGNQAKCLLCHDRQQRCNTCHAVSIPHPADWAEKLHGAQAKATPGPCLQCHQLSLCKYCHEDMPAPFDKAAK